MTREEVFGIMQEIFDNTFDEKVELSDELSAKDVEEWDSLAQIDLIVAIQERFKININLNETDDLKNVGNMVDLIQKKLS